MSSPFATPFWHDHEACRRPSGDAGDGQDGASPPGGPDALRFGWEVLTEPTDLKGCELVIEQIPATVECREFRAVTTLDMPILASGTCGSFEVALLSGEELLIVSMDLAEAEA